MDLPNIQRTLEFLPGIIIGLTVHEYCHAVMAQRCGDTTSRDQGRISLNPMKHIDLLGFIMLLVAGFGWAKPVQFNEQNLRNPRKDVMKIAMAGPLSNAAIAMIMSVLFSIYSKLVPSYNQIVYEVAFLTIYVNWGLFIFNLIPIPPLDGAHVLFNRLRRFPAVHDALYKYGSLLFLGLLIMSSVTKINLLPIGPVIQFFCNGFLSLVGISY